MSTVVPPLAAVRPLARAPEPYVADAIVRIRELRKRFPVRRPLREIIRSPRARRWGVALDGVSLDVRPGELFGLLGPNGAGKTTLFKVLSTLTTPESGTVEVGGFDALRQPERVRRLLTPVIADERSLHWRLSGRENLRLYAALYRLPRGASDAAVTALLSTVGLTDAADRMVATYSSGMKQRVLIARALLSRPRVLLLDEPTRSLDPVTARRLRQLIRDELVRRDGCTVLLATHDAEEAFGLCDRVAVLDRGRVVATGPATSLARQVSDHRYRVRVRAVQVETFEAVSRRADVRTDGEWLDPADGWVSIDCIVGAGNDAVADWIAQLATAGVALTSVAPRPLELAELIERLVAEGGPLA